MRRQRMILPHILQFGVKLPLVLSFQPLILQL